ncbi:NAD+ synthase [Candidatus Pacearchaeota archaeon]|nr:NAD+ synthase [Candidatus Pacearchaeota archaeon]
MKIAIAQITTYPGAIKENTKKIISFIDEARKKKAELVIFPELAIPGYLSMDLILNEKFVETNLEALDEIVKASKRISVIVGFIDKDKEKIRPDGLKVRYNSAAIITDGKLVGVQDKTLLPDYDVFYENRYFAPARKREVFKINGMKIGIEICEDMWDENYNINVSDDLCSNGADLLIDISASPFYLGKRFVRELIIKRIIKRHKMPFVYANLVGVQDGYEGELVFDGQSMVFDNNGNLIALGKEFEEELLMLDLNNKRMGDLGYDEVKELNDALVFGIKEYFARNNFKKAFIGLSGGIDSAVVAALAVQALGKENVIGVFMPSRFSSKESRNDANKLADNLGIGFKIISIEESFKIIEETLKDSFSGKNKDVTEENVQARIRGLILMAFANKFDGLVISTGNKTEMALGYCTLYGDMCGGLSAISDVSKLDVYKIANYINKKNMGEVIPRSSIEKAPSAELAENQTDEKGLGASYDILSPLVDDIIENQMSLEELSKKYPENLAIRIIKKINASEYKRRQAAPGIKVTKKAFGVGRRIPISHKFEG